MFDVLLPLRHVCASYAKHIFRILVSTDLVFEKLWIFQNSMPSACLGMSVNIHGRLEKLAFFLNHACSDQAVLPRTIIIVLCIRTSDVLHSKVMGAFEWKSCAFVIRLPSRNVHRSHAECVDLLRCDDLVALSIFCCFFADFLASAGQCYPAQECSSLRYSTRGAF